MSQQFFMCVFLTLEFFLGNVLSTYLNTAIKSARHACWFRFRLLCLGSQMVVLFRATLKDPMEPIEKINSPLQSGLLKNSGDALPAALRRVQRHKELVDPVIHMRRTTTSWWLIIKCTLMTTMFVLCVCVCKTDAWVSPPCLLSSLAGVYYPPRFCKRSLVECMYTSLKRKEGTLYINTVSMLDITDSTRQERDGKYSQVSLRDQCAAEFITATVHNLIYMYF